MQQQHRCHSHSFIRFLGICPGGHSTFAQHLSQTSNPPKATNTRMSFDVWHTSKTCIQPKAVVRSCLRCANTRPHVRMHFNTAHAFTTTTPAIPPQLCELTHSVVMKTRAINMMRVTDDVWQHKSIVCPTTKHTYTSGALGPLWLAQQGTMPPHCCGASV